MKALDFKLNIILLFKIFILIFANTIFSQEKFSELNMEPNWQLKDTIKLHIIKKEIRESNDGDMASNFFISSTHFEILEKHENGFKIKWKVGNQDLPKLNYPQDVISQIIEYQDIYVIYNTKKSGEFLEIENWEEISDNMADLYNILKVEIPKLKDVNQNELLEQIDIDFIKYRNKENLEYLAFPEIRAFHFPYGKDFIYGQTEEYSEVLPNAFGRTPISSSIKLTLDSLDDNNHIFRIRKTSVLDIANTKNVLINYFKTKGLKEKEIKKQLKKSKSEININDSFLCNYKLGLPLEINTKRESVFELDGVSETRTDEISITLSEF